MSTTVDPEETRMLKNGSAVETQHLSSSCWIALLKHPRKLLASEQYNFDLANRISRLPVSALKATLDRFIIILARDIKDDIDREMVLLIVFRQDDSSDISNGG
ncbi:hypothetical protein BBP40_005387 [Aspergillus hancockii]|nr:hypothetical protein BBP40_005387 [Aspergillus hancockii]